MEAIEKTKEANSTPKSTAATQKDQATKAQKNSFDRANGKAAANKKAQQANNNTPPGNAEAKSAQNDDKTSAGPAKPPSADTSAPINNNAAKTTAPAPDAPETSGPVSGKAALEQSLAPRLPKLKADARQAGEKAANTADKPFDVKAFDKTFKQKIAVNIEKFGGAIDRANADGVNTIAEVAKAADGVERVKGADNLQTSSGISLNAVSTSRGITIDNTLDGQSAAISDVATEELGERFFQETFGGKSEGDFGAEVALRANGGDQAEVTKLRSESANDTVNIAGRTTGEAATPRALYTSFQSFTTNPRGYRASMIANAQASNTTLAFNDKTGYLTRSRGSTRSSLPSVMAAYNQGSVKFSAGQYGTVFFDNGAQVTRSKNGTIQVANALSNRQSWAQLSPQGLSQTALGAKKALANFGINGNNPTGGSLKRFLAAEAAINKLEPIINAKSNTAQGLSARDVEHMANLGKIKALSAVPKSLSSRDTVKIEFNSRSGTVDANLPDLKDNLGSAKDSKDIIAKTNVLFRQIDAPGTSATDRLVIDAVGKDEENLSADISRSLKANIPALSNKDTVQIGAILTGVITSSIVGVTRVGLGLAGVPKTANSNLAIRLPLPQITEAAGEAVAGLTNSLSTSDKIKLNTLIGVIGAGVTVASALGIVDTVNQAKGKKLTNGQIVQKAVGLSGSAGIAAGGLISLYKRGQAGISAQKAANLGNLAGAFFSASDVYNGAFGLVSELQKSNADQNVKAITSNTLKTANGVIGLGLTAVNKFNPALAKTFKLNQIRLIGTGFALTAATLIPLGKRR